MFGYFRKKSKARSNWHGDFSSYDDALDECREGYLSRDLANFVCGRQDRLFEEGATVLSALPWYHTGGLYTALALAKSDRGLKVLDFGGSSGTHFHLVEKVYQQAQVGKWAVVETEEMASRAIASNRDPERLRFFTSIEDAKHWLNEVDLVLSSGAVQYTPDPMATIDLLASIQAPVMALCRCAFSLSNRKIITIQRSWLSDNGRGPLPPDFVEQEVLYPITYLPQNDVELGLSKYYKHFFAILNDATVKLGHHERVRSGDALICMLPSGK